MLAVNLRRWFLIVSVLVTLVITGLFFQNCGNDFDSVSENSIGSIDDGSGDPVSQPPLTTDPTVPSELLFRANYSADMNPTFGFSGESIEHKGTRYNQALISSAGPNGQNVFSIDQISAPNLPDYGGQYGWGHAINLPNWQNNSSRFFRLRLKMNLNNNYRGVTWSDGQLQRSINKFLHIGVAPGRYILNIEGEDYGSNTWGWSLQIDGGAYKVERFGLQNGVWYDVQMELKYGSAAYAKLWINDMNYNAPWLQTPIFSQSPPASSGYTGLGYFNNNGLASGGIFGFQHTDFEVGTTFNSTW